MIDVRSTFENTEILLTGGNGFLGKVIIALLLDRYPRIGRLHVAMRPRRGRSAAERFEQDVLRSPPLEGIVERLGAEFIERKIVVWDVDLKQRFLGLKEQQIDAWRGRIGLIINCAGLVEFFPPVEESLEANVDSLSTLAETAKRIGAKLLHVSTCYVAGAADALIEESEPIAGFYPLRRGPDDSSFDHRLELERLRARAGELRRDTAKSPREISDALVDLGRRRAARWGWVNTYTYAKSLGEQMLEADPEAEFSIVRPAIVESSWSFPFPGWIEGGRTAAPLVLMALGGMRDWPARPELSLEVVPVDMVAGGILSVAALLLHGEAERVYQLAASESNPFEMERLLELLVEEARRRPLNGSNGASAPVGLNGGRRLRLLSAERSRAEAARLRGRARTVEEILRALSAGVQRIGLPGAAALKRKADAARTLALQSRFREQIIEQYLPFILENRYCFEAANIREGRLKLSAEDRRKLPWAPEEIDWRKYWRENQIGGILKWVQPESVRNWSFQI